MNIDVREMSRDPFWLFASVVGLIAIKAGILVFLARQFRLSWATSIKTGLLLGPGGEFAFVVLGMATTLGIVEDRISSFAIAVTSLTMVLIPVLSTLGRRIAERIDPAPAIARELAEPTSGLVDHAIVIGHGRVGQVVCAMLDRHKLRYIAVDSDPNLFAEKHQGGGEVSYGNATDPQFLRHCGLMKARAVIVTIAETRQIDEIVRWIRSIRKDVLIVSRARDAAHARHLYSIGVNEAVPETIEASLQLSEAALLGMGQAMGKVIASIHEKRDEFRQALQVAERAGGQ
jgi:CPA2 family monovalent cation:H+ antiporter-2